MLPITTPSAAISLQAVGIETEENEGVDWLTFDGYWGDKKLDDDDSRQFCAFGQCRFTDGPLGELSLSFPPTVLSQARPWTDSAYSPTQFQLFGRSANLPSFLFLSLSALTSISDS